jgi:hypothetical protein
MGQNGSIRPDILGTLDRIYILNDGMKRENMIFHTR